LAFFSQRKKYISTAKRGTFFHSQRVPEHKSQALFFCRFHPAVARAVQLLSRSGGNALQPAGAGYPTALVKNNNLFN